VNSQRSKLMQVILHCFIPARLVFLYAIVILFSTPSISVAESFIYIEKKPVLWIYPQDPVYQAWYKHADLIKLANLMQQSGAQQLAIFTKTALNQMAVMYDAEATKSREEKSSGAGQNFEKSRWRHSAVEYAEKLRLVSQYINQTTEIKLYIEEYGEPTIVIDGKPYILTSPDLKKSGLLYAAIVENLCGQGICLQDDETQEVEDNKLRIVVKAEWKMAVDSKPEYLSEDGLHFVFSDLQDRKKKQEICLRAMRELGLIAESLKEISNKGVSIDWDVLDLELISGSYGHKLIINSFKDSLVMDLIVLGQNDNLFTQAIPWLKATVKGEIVQHRFDEADELLAKYLN
jgi:hypothetical protein